MRRQRPKRRWLTQVGRERGTLTPSLLTPGRHYPLNYSSSKGLFLESCPYLQSLAFTCGNPEAPYPTEGSGAPAEAPGNVWSTAPLPLHIPQLPRPHYPTFTSISVSTHLFSGLKSLLCLMKLSLILGAQRPLHHPPPLTKLAFGFGSPASAFKYKVVLRAIIRSTFSLLRGSPQAFPGT